MALVWSDGTTILMARRPQHGLPQLDVLASRWDRTNECFMLEARIHIPTEEEESDLLAAGCVADSETGILKSYLVIEKDSSLVIITLDLDENSFEVAAELSFPNSGPIRTAIKGCSLADGPTVLGVWDGQLLVVNLTSPEMPNGSYDDNETMDYVWEAHVLQVGDSIQKPALNVHFCGEITRDAGLEAVLSVTLDNKGKGHKIKKYLSWSTERKRESRDGMTAPFRLGLSEHVPADVEPQQVSCMQALADRPGSTAVSKDLLIGTADKKLLKCRHGEVIETVHLDGIPSQLHFAVVAGGQGVIVVVLDGDSEESSVVAICAESFQKLQEWSKIWKVVVGDFTSCGHDQIVLLQGSMNSVANCKLYLPLAQNGLDTTSIHGFSKFESPGTPQGSQQHLNEVKAINDHQMSGLDTILKALEERVEAGIAELKVAEHQLESKKELYRVATRVMQGTVSKHALLDLMGRSDELGESHEPDGLQVVRVAKIQNRICGTKWSILVEIEILKVWSRAILQDVSLFVTSLNGAIGGSSSVLKSLSFEEGSRCLVMTVPLETLSLLPSYPFHVFIKAACVSTGKASSTALESQRCQRAYTQWLCCSEVPNPITVQPLDQKEAAELITIAGEQRQFVVEGKCKESILQLADTMKTDLCLQDISDDKFEKSERIFNLMSLTGVGIVYAKVCCLGTHAIVTLKCSDARLMAMVQQSLLLLFCRHQLQVLRGMPQHDTLEKVRILADALLEELEHMESADGEDKSYSSKLLRLQMATDRSCAEAVSSLT